MARTNVMVSPTVLYRMVISLFALVSLDRPGTAHPYLAQPNAAAQARQTGGARDERTLSAVACSRLFGKAPASCAPAPSMPRTPIGLPHRPAGAGRGAS